MSQEIKVGDIVKLTRRLSGTLGDPDFCASIPSHATLLPNHSVFTVLRMQFAVASIVSPSTAPKGLYYILEDSSYARTHYWVHSSWVVPASQEIKMPEIKIGCKVKLKVDCEDAGYKAGDILVVTGIDTLVGIECLVVGKPDDDFGLDTGWSIEKKYFELFEEKPKEEELKTCTCPIRIILMQGCICGGFRAEFERSHKNVARP